MRAALAVVLLAAACRTTKGTLEVDGVPLVYVDDEAGELPLDGTYRDLQQGTRWLGADAHVNVMDPWPADLAASGTPSVRLWIPLSARDDERDWNLATYFTLAAELPVDAVLPGASFTHGDGQLTVWDLEWARSPAIGDAIQVDGEGTGGFVELHIPPVDGTLEIVRIQSGRACGDLGEGSSAVLAYDFSWGDDQGASAVARGESVFVLPTEVSCPLSEQGLLD